MGTATEVTYLPPNRVTAWPMYKSIQIATIYNPTSNPVAITVNGVVYSTADGSLTLTERGTGIVWTGTLDCRNIGLSDNTRYSWTVTQGSNSDSGSYFHNLKKGSDARIYFGSCDCNTTFSDEVTGYYNHMKSAHLAGTEVAAYVMTDDYGYVDSQGIKDDGTGSYNYPTITGYATGGQPQVVQTVDAYLIGWCAILGMLGPEDTVYSDAELTGTTTKDLRRVLWGREENRAYVRKNFNLILTKKSDHDTTDDMGWDISPSYDSSFANSSTAFDYMFDGGIPKITDYITPTDTAAGHWMCEIGDISIGSLDYITNAARSSWVAGNEGVVYGDSTQISQFTSLFGNAQIDDYHNARIAADCRIHIMISQFSIRYWVARTSVSPPNVDFTDAVAERGNGAQHPLFDHCLPEFQRLFTEQGNTAKSLMDDPRTNGRTGCFFIIGGDLHLWQAVACQHPQYVDGTTSKTNLAENFWHVNIGTINKSSLTSSVGSPGDTLADMKMLANEAADVYDNWYGCYVDVKGSDAPVSARLRVADKNDTTLLEKRFVPIRTGNTGRDSTVNVKNNSVGVVYSE